MGLYLGKDKVKINLNGKAYNINLIANLFIPKGVKLLSSDGYILKDSNGLYLIPKESE